MQVSRVISTYFSPTGATTKVAKHLGQCIAARLGVAFATSDLTTPRKRVGERNFEADELVVLATPTYAGRVPNKIAPELERLLVANGSPCVVVTTFGNRNPDSSLIELAFIAEAAGMHVIAALSMATRHAFTDKLAAGHPNDDDLRLLDELADEVAELLAQASDASLLKAPLIRDGVPMGEYYKPLRADGEPAVFLKAKPATDAQLCDRCGICVAACPVGSIDKENPLETPGVCIKCQACVRLCPQKAKHFDHPDFLSHVQMLEENYTRPYEPEVYVGTIEVK